MTECQRETGVVNGLLVAWASWLRVNRSILERRTEQVKASEPSMSRDWGGRRGGTKLRGREERSVSRKAKERVGKEPKKRNAD